MPADESPDRKQAPKKKAAGGASKKAATKKKAATRKAPAKKAATKKAAKKAPQKKAAAKKGASKQPAAKKGPAKETHAAEAAAAETAAAETPAQATSGDEAEAAAADRVQDAPATATRRLPPLPPRRADGVITIGFSPDADDAFMFYALLEGKIETGERRYELVREEIQALNVKAQEGVYDVTAISFGAWHTLASRYLLMNCGASFGDGRGPVLVAKTPIRPGEVEGLRVAVPGLLTTAALALRLWLSPAQLDLLEVPFEEVLPAVKSGRARAGVLIHERQLTWRADNLVRVKDFGQWWGERTEGLPLPLGANAIRRDISEDDRHEIELDVKRSIAYALGHREDALDYAMRFAKGLPRALVDRYVAMYVGELALDFAERGRQAIVAFFEEAKRQNFVPAEIEPEFSSSG